jgi:hypothetical protein
MRQMNFLSSFYSMPRAARALWEGGNHTGELAPLHDLAALSAPAGHLVLCIGTLNHLFSDQRYIA